MDVDVAFEVLRVLCGLALAKAIRAGASPSAMKPPWSVPKAIPHVQRLETLDVLRASRPLKDRRDGNEVGRVADRRQTGRHAVRHQPNPRQRPLQTRPAALRRDLVDDRPGVRDVVRRRQPRDHELGDRIPALVASNSPSSCRASKPAVGGRVEHARGVAGSRGGLCAARRATRSAPALPWRRSRRRARSPARASCRARSRRRGGVDSLEPRVRQELHELLRALDDGAGSRSASTCDTRCAGAIAARSCPRSCHASTRRPCTRARRAASALRRYSRM